MSELQAEQTDSTQGSNQYVIDGPDEVVQQEPENPNGEGAELASAEPVEANKDTVDGESQDSVQKAINKQHRKFREEERARQHVERELEEARKKLAELQAPQDIEIPPMPDSWDDDFDQKMQARDAAIMRKAQADAIRQAEEDRLYQAQQEQQLKQQRDTQVKLEAYRGRAVENGIKEADLVIAANRVADSGVSPEVAEFLLTDPDGPIITAYLADESNTLELYELANMSPVLAGMKLNDIRSKAGAMRKTAPGAPPPPEVVSGKGAPDDLTPNLRGATFE